MPYISPAQMFARFAFSSLFAYHEGNPFSQITHDGATLEDHGKRLAMGAELIMKNPRYIPRDMLDLAPPPPAASRASALVEAAQGGKATAKPNAAPHTPEYDKPPQQVLSFHPVACARYHITFVLPPPHTHCASPASFIAADVAVSRYEASVGQHGQDGCSAT